MYRAQENEGNSHDNKSILFMNPVTGADINTTESRWHHVKATLNPY
jgi:hypothetical protein